MTAWSIHFGWPAGDVWGNLLASGICAGAVYWRARIHLRRQARQHAEQQAQTHAMLQRLHDHLGVEPPEEDQT